MPQLLKTFHPLSWYSCQGNRRKLHETVIILFKADIKTPKAEKAEKAVKNEHKSIDRLKSRQEDDTRAYGERGGW